MIETKHSLLSELSENYEGMPPSFKLLIKADSGYYGNNPSILTLSMKFEDQDPKYAEKMERYRLDREHYQQSLQNRLADTQKELEQLLQEELVK